MKTILNKICWALIFSLFTIEANAAAPQNQVPSCYLANPKIEQKSPAPQRWIYLIIDQTVMLDDNLKQSLADIVKHNLQPGMGFSVFSFSAFSQGRYMTHLSTGIFELPIADAKIRNGISVPALQKFDACMKGQYGYGIKLAMDSIGKVLQASSAELTKSDVISSLSEISRLVKENQIKNKQVLVVSDMLENSTVSSFYSQNAVRKIDAEKELKTVEANNLLGDFSGAGIYIMGAGMLPWQKDVKVKGVQYRDPKTLAGLKKFWEGYFSRSNAKLEEFGTPELLSPIRWQ